MPYTSRPVTEEKQQALEEINVGAGADISNDRFKGELNLGTNGVQQHHTNKFDFTRSFGSGRMTTTGSAGGASSI